MGSKTKCRSKDNKYNVDARVSPFPFDKIHIWDKVLVIKSKEDQIE